MSKKKTTPMYAEVLEAYQEHETYAATADALGPGVSRWTVARVLKGNYADETLVAIGHPKAFGADTDERREAERLRMQVDALKSEVKRLQSDHEEAKVWGEFGSLVLGQSRRVRSPDFLDPEAPTQGDADLVAMAAYSDTHWGEVVNPAEVEYANGFDSTLAEERTDRYFRNLVRLSTDYLPGRYKGLVLAFLGDNISGDIHAELAETNQEEAVEAVVNVASTLERGIRHLAPHYPSIYIPCVTGNHGRTTRKPRAKKRNRKNFDWLIYVILKDRLRDLDNVTLDISEGPDLRFQVLGTRYVITHGDQFRGGSGISGALSPMMLGQHRKKKRSQAMGKPYDIMVMGHWHQLMLGVSQIIANGCVKGYDEYAYSKNFEFQPPEQAFWVNDPDHGVTVRAPVHTLGDDEWWMNLEGKDQGAVFS